MLQRSNEMQPFRGRMDRLSRALLYFPRIAEQRSSEDAFMLLAKAYYATTCGAAVFLFPYMTLYLSDLGANAQMVGLLCALRPWMSMVSSMAGPALADRCGCHRAMLLVCFGLSCLMRLMMGLPGGFVQVAVLLLAADLLLAPVGPMADAMIMQRCKQESDWGRQRVWGSIAWGGLAPLAGWLVERHGMAAGFTGFALLAIPATLTIGALAPPTTTRLPAASHTALNDRQQPWVLKPSQPAEVNQPPSSALPRLEATHQLQGCSTSAMLSQPDTQHGASGSTGGGSGGSGVGGSGGPATLPMPEVGWAAPGSSASSTQPTPHTSNISHTSHTLIETPVGERDRGEQAMVAAGAVKEGAAGKVTLGVTRRRPAAKEAQAVALFPRQPGSLPDEASSAAVLPDEASRAAGPQGSSASVGFAEGMGQLLGSAQVWQLLLQCLASGLGAGLIGTYLFLYARELDASTALMGMLLFTDCASETPIFYLQDRVMAVMDPAAMMNLALGAMVVRLVLYGAVPLLPEASAWALLPIELLQGLTLAIACSAVTVQSKRLAPSGLTATMQGLSSAVMGGLGCGAGGLIGGLMLDAHLGWSTTWTACAAVVAGLWGLSLLVPAAHHQLLGRKGQ
ncbi:major facilitator superfamily domain-containing protein [Haematococcus lacustris]